MSSLGICFCFVRLRDSGREWRANEERWILFSFRLSSRMEQSIRHPTPSVHFVHTQTRDEDKSGNLLANWQFSLDFPRVVDEKTLNN